MKNQKVHAGLLVLIGGYFFFIAYHLYENMRSGSTDMSPAGFIAAIAVFCLVALGAFVYAFLVWRKGEKGGKANNESKEPSDDPDKRL